MNTPISIGLVGVTGYTGMELVRLLAGHRHFNLCAVTSRKEAGRRLDDIYPFLSGFPSGEIVISEPDPDELARCCELVFLAVPHGTAMDMAAELITRGLKVVDLSADFRLRDPEVYAEWYGLEHRHPDLIEEAVFGLPEVYAEDIKKARLIANPGCYVTSVLLGLAPALKNDLVHTNDLVADSKSGATGAGRGANQATLFCEVSDTFRAYGIASHRHTPEMEQELSLMSQHKILLSFNPHLLPINRGILSTIYTRPKRSVSTEEVVALYRKEYLAKPWVRVLDAGQLPQTRYVRGTMFCDIGLVSDERTGRLVILSAIDNLCRGASGQALANANLMCGLDMAEGLGAPPLMP